jgi:hypothetical protein
MLCDRLYFVRVCVSFFYPIPCLIFDAALRGSVAGRLACHWLVHHAHQGTECVGGRSICWVVSVIVRVFGECCFNSW